MALIKHFCCGCNVRSGSIFSGFYSMISSALFVGLICIYYVGYGYVDTSETLAIVIYATIALFMLLLATSVSLIVGVYMDIQMLFVPWLMITSLCILEASGAFVWHITMKLRNDQTVQKAEMAIVTCHVANSIFLIYCMVAVTSQLQDLMAGKGTSRYYRRRSQLRRQRLPPRITPIPVELLGLPPPPPGVRVARMHRPGLRVINTPMPPPYSEQPPPYATNPMAAAPTNIPVTEAVTGSGATATGSGENVVTDTFINSNTADDTLQVMATVDSDTDAIPTGNTQLGDDDNNNNSNHGESTLPSFHYDCANVVSNARQLFTTSRNATAVTTTPKPTAERSQTSRDQNRGNSPATGNPSDVTGASTSSLIAMTQSSGQPQVSRAAQPDTLATASPVNIRL